MIYMDESFNISYFVPVVVGTAITHHSLLTSLWVNVSHIPLKILLLPLTSNTMVALGQMALLRYVAQQGITVQEKQAWLKLMPAEVDPTIKSDTGSTSSKAKPVPDKVAMMLSKKDRLEAQSSKTPLLPLPPGDPPAPPRLVTPLPLPPPSPAQKHSTPQNWTCTFWWLNGCTDGAVQAEPFTGPIPIEQTN